MLTKLRVCAHLVVGILIGIVFYNFGNDAAKIDSNIACVFTGLLFLFFGNSMPAVQMCKFELLIIANFLIIHAIQTLQFQSKRPFFFESI